MTTTETFSRKCLKGYLVKGYLEILKKKSTLFWRGEWRIQAGGKAAPAPRRPRVHLVALARAVPPGTRLARARGRGSAARVPAWVPGGVGICHAP